MPPSRKNCSRLLEPKISSLFFNFSCFFKKAIRIREFDLSLRYNDPHGILFNAAACVD